MYDVTISNEDKTTFNLTPKFNDDLEDSIEIVNEFKIIGKDKFMDEGKIIKKLVDECEFLERSLKKEIKHNRNLENEGYEDSSTKLAIVRAIWRYININKKNLNDNEDLQEDKLKTIYNNIKDPFESIEAIKISPRYFNGHSIVIENNNREMFRAKIKVEEKWDIEEDSIENNLDLVKDSF